MSTCIILGDRSDIAVSMSQFLRADGWDVIGWNRETIVRPWVKVRQSGNVYIEDYTNWDLCLIAIGKVSPVGLWWHQNDVEWEDNIESNLLLPVRLLRQLWPFKKPNARVCFMAGSNPNTVMAGYSAYNAGKMALLKVVEQLDVESQDAVLFALGPGVTDTKIHNATKEAKWPNPRLERAMKDGSFTPMAKVYECLRWAMSQPKEVIGGRNICVSDPYGAGLSVRLRNNPNLFKLRRIEAP